MKQFNDLTVKGEVIYEIHSTGEIKERKIDDMILNRRSLNLNIMSEGKPFLKVRGNEYWKIQDNIIYTPNKGIIELVSFIINQKKK